MLHVTVLRYTRWICSTDTSSKGCTPKHIPNLPNWSHERQESMKISSPKCLHPKALSWFFRENIWQFGIVWEMPLTSVHNPPPPQNPSNTHLYSRTTPYWTKNILFYSIQHLKWTKSEVTDLLTHIPQNEDSGKTHPYPPPGRYHILPGEDTHPIANTYASSGKKSSGINTNIPINNRRKTCIIQRKWVTLQSKGKQEGGGAQQPWQRTGTKRQVKQFH